MKKIEIYWGDIIKPASKTEDNTRYILINPTAEDTKEHIKTYTNIESIITEINNTKTYPNIITTFPQDYKIIRYENKTYSLRPLSDEKIKIIESTLKEYKSKHRKTD